MIRIQLIQVRVRVISFSYSNLGNNAQFQGGAWSLFGEVNMMFTNVVFQNTWASIKGSLITSHSALLLLLGGCIFNADASIVLSGVTFDVLSSFYLI